MTVVTDICNLALSHLGDKGSIESIEIPEKQTEIVCAKWIDVSRQTALRQMMPSFARKREIWPLDAEYVPAFGYEYAYLYKKGCLKILGIGNLYEKNNDYAVEDNHLLTNGMYETGLPVRYVADVKDPNKYTPDFIDLMSWVLASNICIELTENDNKFAQINQMLPVKIMQYCGVDAQENKPIRIEHSELMRARAGLWPMRRKA